MKVRNEKRFGINWHFNGMGELNLGVSISLNAKNIEIHLPGGFFRIGMQRQDKFFVLSSSKKIRQYNESLVQIPDKIKKKIEKLVEPYLAKETK